MKIIFILIALACIQANAYGQKTNDDLKKMLDSAVILQTKHPDKVPFREGIYLIGENNHAYILSSQVDREKFSEININDKRNRNLLKKGIDVWKVSSTLRGSEFVISIIEFKVRYKNRNYSFTNMGGARVTYEYLCDKNRWVFQNTHWLGI